MSDRTKLIEVKCTYCNKIFHKTLHRYKEALKLKYKPFCSKECKNNYKITSIKTKCFNCGKEIKVLRSQYIKSISKKFYCNMSCAATSNNKLKGPKSQEIKNKIRNGVRKYLSSKGMELITDTIKKCPICNVSFNLKTKKQIFCSKKCSQIFQFSTLPYTKDDFVNKIIEISKETGRTPQRRECKRNLETAAIRFFGTWNKAMIKCNLKPNSSKYQKVRLLCIDGHIADSISEKIIDDWLYKNKINHEKNKKYPNSNMNCDFYLIDYDLWIEYFGLFGGDIPEYDNNILIKEKIAKDKNLKLISIKPNDLYGSKILTYDEKLKNIFNSFMPR